MGYGTYSTSTFAANTSSKIASGKSFSYDRTVRSSGKYEAHELVDPALPNKSGIKIRESRDSVEHPNTTNILVALDVTGSMANTPRKVQAKMGTLFGLLNRRAYCEDPAVAFACYGDSYTDQVPLQITQFEADNNLDDAIDTFFLEGNGGGNGGETATLLWWYLNKFAVTDAYEKRGEKGYLFIIADEIALPLKPAHIKKFIKDEEPPAETLTVNSIVEELKQKWEVYVLLIDNSSAHWQGSQKFYTELFGKNNVILIEDDENIIETVGAMVGKLENDDLDDKELLDDLVSVGAELGSAEKTVQALSKFNPNKQKNAVAKTGLKIETDETDVEFI